jgi:hypothetical protein
MNLPVTTRYLPAWIDTTAARIVNYRYDFSVVNLLAFSDIKNINTLIIIDNYFRFV